MRICFLSRRFFPAISGMSVYALNLLRQLIRHGCDVTMISQFRGDEAGARVYGGGPPPDVPGVRVIGLEALGEQSGGNFEADIAGMVHVAADEHARQSFDIIHAQYGYPNGLAALEASRLLGVPNVVSIQGGDGHWVGTCCSTHKEAMLAVLGHADRLLIGARSFAEEVRANHGTPLERFTIVPGAVDVHRFHPRDGWAAGEWIDAQRPTLLYHGRVDRRKGALDLLDAWAIVSKNQPGARLIVSGIGPDVDSSKERIENLGLEDSVQMTGYVEYASVPDVYRRADVFLSPTYAEGFSNTILEAMASGIPVISTRTVGVVDCLRDEDNGLLVEPGDVPALAEAMLRMLEDDDLRKRLAMRALDEARQTYSWESVGAQIIEIYRGLLGAKPDTGWQVTNEIAPCRFRSQPHLL